MTYTQLTISVFVALDLSASACFFSTTSLSFSSSQSSDVSLSSSRTSQYKLLFSALRSISKSWENLHLSPFPQVPKKKNGMIPTHLLVLAIEEYYSFHPSNFYLAWRMHTAQTLDQHPFQSFEQVELVWRDLAFLSASSIQLLSFPSPNVSSPLPSWLQRYLHE